MVPLKTKLIVIYGVLALALPSTLRAEDEHLSTIGSLGASNLYMIFLSIGMLGDSFENGVYKSDVATSLAQEVVALNGTSKASLSSLVEAGGVVGEDRLTVLEMIEAHNLLEKQAGELLKYMGNKNSPNDFQFFRKKSWELIAKILGIPLKE